MLYRLLRNNKESGPFTALQLKEMGLKPYDLLWTEGRGAAWQYASELNELKDFAPLVEDQPFDRFFKRKEDKEAEQQTTVAVKKTKPRFRISGDKVIMVEAGNMEVANNGLIKETMPVRMVAEMPVKEKAADAPEWQNTYSEWQPQPQKKEVKTEEPVAIETKYSESLDDLKKRYAEKVLSEKSGKSSSLSSASVKQNIMAAVALIVLTVGGYIGYTLKQKDAAVTTGKPVVERADIAGDNSLSTQQPDNSTDASNTVQNNLPSNNITGKNTETSGAANAGKTNAEKSSALLTSTKENNTKLSVTAPQKKDASAVVKTTTGLPDKTTGKPAVIDNKETVKTSNNTVDRKPNVSQPTTTTAKGNSGNSIVPAQVIAPPVVKQTSNKQIGDYVSVKKLGGSGSSVQNVRLLVSNVSDFPIDLAVVDIQYFDSKGKYQKGETMYVKDINGGNNVEVRVPDSDKSSSIKYKVSMVQADQKTLYLVAD